MHRLLNIFRKTNPAILFVFAGILLSITACEKNRLKDIEVNKNPFDENYEGDCDQTTINQVTTFKYAPDPDNPDSLLYGVYIEYALNCTYNYYKQDFVDVYRDNNLIGQGYFENDSTGSFLDFETDSGKTYEYYIQLNGIDNAKEMPASNVKTISIP